MTPIPTDPIGLIIWLINLGLITVSFGEATDRLRTGIAAQAQKEGRDVTPEENALIKATEEAAVNEMKGK